METPATMREHLQTLYTEIETYTHEFRSTADALLNLQPLIREKESEIRIAVMNEEKRLPPQRRMLSATLQAYIEHRLREELGETYTNYLILERKREILMQMLQFLKIRAEIAQQLAILVSVEAKLATSML